jgi:DNA-binding XRE family transcriptional regulator
VTVAAKVDIMTAKITGAQVRAARGFLRWTISDLATAADVGSSTVQAVEREDGVPSISGGPASTREYRAGARDEALAKIETAFAKQGVAFLPDDRKAGPGVRWRAKS